MKCQNCGFESADNICSVCGAEIIEAQDETAKISENSTYSVTEQQTAETEKQKSKKSVKKILFAVLLIILSVAVVSASSIVIYSFVINDGKTRFNKLHQTVNCGDFSIKLKEVKTPEFVLEYYPQIVYDLVFEFHNNTSQEIYFDMPILIAVSDENSYSGYLGQSYDTYYDLNDSSYIQIPAWSSVDITERMYFEDYSLNAIAYSGYSSVSDRDKLKYEKEELEKYKESSPESFYLFMSVKKCGMDEEYKHVRFLIETDKQAIEIPEGDNIE